MRSRSSTPRAPSPVPGKAGTPGRPPLAAILLLAAACSPGGGDAGGESASGTAGTDPGPAEFPAPTSPPDGVEGPAIVRPGIEVLLSDSFSLVRGRRAGLITNHTGLDRGGTPSIDLLADHAEVELVALFSPEHGIRGRAGAGVKVAGGVDERTGLPIHSLYGSTRKPTPEMLDGIEVLLFDIQDIGTRYYTYLSTMALAMEAAGEHGIGFVVLDRPNPIGGDRVQGNVLDPGFASFVGLYPIPMRHGLTAGEFARMAVGEFGVGVALSVVVADGWERTMAFGETGIPWIAPSPNMPSVESALHYPGTCLFEGTPVSVGRGTERAFQHVGAPWLDGEELAARVGALGVPGARFVAVRFTPREPGDGKFGGTEVGGVRLEAAGPSYDPTLAALALLVEIKAMSGDRWSWRKGHFDRLAGTEGLRIALDAGASFGELAEGWGEGVGGYLARREGYLLYR